MKETASVNIFLLYLAAVVLGCVSLSLAGCSSHTHAPMVSGESPSSSGKLPASSSKALSEQERRILNSARGTVVSSVPSSGMPSIESQYAYYVKGAGRSTIKAGSKRAEKYLAYARKVFRKKGIPEELVYIAMVESGFNIKARSSAGAVGAWQFIRYTGMKYGLNQDPWKDERLDFYKSANAAASYLQNLYSQFGDWPTAIAAYNAGEGKMTRACKATGETTFFGVCRKNATLDVKTKLAKETRDYVPRFIAMSVIMDNLESLGFTPIYPERISPPAQVDVPPNTDLQAMAKACGMEWSAFSAYNPHCLAKASSPGSISTIYFPQNVKELAISYAKNPALASRLPAGDLPASKNAPTSSLSQARGSSRPTSPTKGSSSTPLKQGKKYKLQAGETLYSVAKSHGISLQELLTANGIREARLIKPGSTIIIPSKSSPSSSRASSRQAGNAPSSKGGASYTVQANDTLWRISKKFNVSVEDLQRWNGMGKNQTLSVGQKLLVQGR